MLLLIFIIFIFLIFLLIKVKSINENFNNQEIDLFVTGEKLHKLCDVCIYKKEYVNRYIDKKFCKKIIYIEDNLLKNKDIITKSFSFFVRIDEIDFFEQKILPLINKPFVLVSHNSAYTAGCLDKNLHTKNIESQRNILNNKFLVKWYGQNMIPNKNTVCLPVGLENTYRKKDYNIIIKNKNNSKDKLLYINFENKTNKDRQKVKELLYKKGFKSNKKEPYENYIKELSRNKFCISPPGKGFDCIRHWECLYLGTIPIILIDQYKIVNTEFNDLPFLFVKDYNEINEKFLNKKYLEFKKKNFNLGKSKMSYWEQQFRNDKLININ
jgi:hypothetical protein